MQIADISVLTTRLPAVDRGTLSQAWIDALHLHRGAAQSPAAAGTIHAFTGGGNRPHISEMHVAAVHAETQRDRVIARRTLRLIGPHRDSSISAQCARGAKSAPVPRVRPRVADSAIIHMPCGERICLLMRGTVDAMIVTVLCSPAMHNRVAAAMQHIRGVLAAQGKNCRVEMARAAA